MKPSPHSKLFRQYCLLVCLFWDKVSNSLCMWGWPWTAIPAFTLWVQVVLLKSLFAKLLEIEQASCMLAITLPTETSPPWRMKHCTMTINPDKTEISYNNGGDWALVVRALDYHHRGTQIQKMQSSLDSTATDGSQHVNGGRVFSSVGAALTKYPRLSRKHFPQLQSLESQRSGSKWAKCLLRAAPTSQDGA